MASAAEAGDQSGRPASGAAAFPPPREGWYAVGVLATATTFAMLDQGILALLIIFEFINFR